MSTTTTKASFDQLLSRYAILLRSLRNQLHTDIDQPLSGWRARFNLRLSIEDLASRPNLANALMALDLDSEHQAEQEAAISKARSVVAAEIELAGALDRLYGAVESSYGLSLEAGIQAYERVPEVILLFRHRAGISRATAADRAGIDEDDWQQLEALDSRLSSAEIHTAAAGLGTTFEALARYARILTRAEEEEQGEP